MQIEFRVIYVLCDSCSFRVIRVLSCMFRVIPVLYVCCAVPFAAAKQLHAQVTDAI